MPEKIPWPFTRLYDRYPNRIFAKWFRLIAEDIKGRNISGTVLDIGTGPGRLPIEIAKQVGDIEIIGIDISDDMVKIAKRNAEKEKLGNRIKFEVASAYNTSLADSSVDLVTSTGMLHHLKEPIKAFNEIYRVLKPEGEAWIYDGRKDVTRMEFKGTVRRLGIEKDLPIPMWLIERMWPRWHVGFKTEAYTSGKIGTAIRESLFKDYNLKNEGPYVKLELKKVPK